MVFFINVFLNYVVRLEKNVIQSTVENMAELTQQYSQQSSANLTGVVSFRIIAEYKKKSTTLIHGYQYPD